MYSCVNVNFIMILIFFSILIMHECPIQKAVHLLFVLVLYMFGIPMNFTILPMVTSNSIRANRPPGLWQSATTSLRSGCAVGGTQQDLSCGGLKTRDLSIKMAVFNMGKAMINLINNGFLWGYPIFTPPGLRK